MTLRRPTKQEVRARALADARAKYVDANVSAYLAEEKAKSARRMANSLLFAWVDLLEPLAARALKGK